MKNEIYHKSRTYACARQIAKLGSDDISQANKGLIMAFHTHLFAKSASQLRVAKLVGQLRNICKWLGSDLNNADRLQIQSLVAQINMMSDYADETKADYRRCITQFYKWFRDEDPRLDSADPSQLKTANKLYKYIDTNIKTSCMPKKVEYSNIITEEDIWQVIDKGCKTVRDKAFLKLLHESGCRAGEFLNIKLKDMALLNNRAVILVDGKTGERRIPVVQSLPYIIQHINIHPLKDDPEAYLWLNMSSVNTNEPLKHRGAQKLVDRAFKAAGVNKRLNLHWFRHSRATLLAPKLTEYLLCQYMGWVIGSRQARRYVHLCPEQLETEMLTIHGLEERKEEDEKPRLCSCEALNDSRARYCYKCGKPLDVSVALQDQETVKQETDTRLKMYAAIMSDPVKRQKFEEFKALMSLT